MEKVNPELVKYARRALAVLMKEGFVTSQDVKAAQGGAMPPPGAMPPGAPPMDPAAMGGAMPMDPAAMGGAMPPPMPMDPMAGGAMPPMPPMPPGPPMPPPPPAPPGAEGGAPPPEGSQPVQLNLEDLIMLFQEISGSGGGEGAPNEGADSVGMGKRMDSLETKLDELKSMIETMGGGVGGPPPEGAGAAPEGEAGAMPPLPPLPPGLEGALAGGGGDAAGMGAAMDPAMAGGQPMPMVPGGGMEAAAAPADDGIVKRSKAFEVSELVSRLKKG